MTVCSRCNDRAPFARGLCSPCYSKAYKRGTLPERKNKSPEERLQMSRRGDEECWPWVGTLDRDGYGIASHSRAHRWAYEHLVGQIDPNLTIDHLCSNRSCVNPAHMEPVPIRVNVLRAETGITAQNARKTKCVNGHEFTPENTYSPPGKTGRQCRQCKNDWQRNRRAQLSNT